MKSLRKQKMSVWVVLAIAMIVLSVMLFFVPTYHVSASSLDDFDAFQDAIYEMMKLDENQTSSIDLQSEESEEKEYCRIILTTDKDVDDCGAIMSASYKDYRVFQYQDSESSALAFEYYSNLPEVTSLSYDFDIKVEANVENGAVTSAQFNSWGADYVGYGEYQSTLLESTSVDNLNKVVVVVLDSGINTEHKLFQGRILHQYAKDYTNDADESATQYLYEDYNGHGTHVSGIIADATLSNVYILPLKVLTEEGTGSVNSIVRAIEYVCTIQSTLKSAGYDLKVMNMSIGIDYGSSQVSALKTSTLSSVIKKAYNDNKIVSVVAAGNESKNTSDCVPANVEEAIVVSAATERTYGFYGSQLIFDSSYSNYGETVDFTAPGTSIKSAYIDKDQGYGGDEETEYLSGTSMATPHVTGAVALVYSNPTYSNLEPADLNTLLQENADKSCLYTGGNYTFGNFDRNDYYGYGLINIAKIGTVIEGEVDFSEDEMYHESEFSLTLSYETTLSENQYMQIYYTTDEDATSVNKLTGIKYTGAIKLSKTTKVTATAFVYGQSAGETVLIRRSMDVSKCYYFNNIDFLSKYTVNSDHVLESYTGTKLTTLVVPDSLGVKIIKKGAFSSSPVKKLYLPNTITKFSNLAFEGNSKIEEIYCSSAGLTIGNKAFYGCKNLNVVQVGKITSVGDLAFAYTGLTDFELLYATSVGENAFSSSALKRLVVGKNITTFGSQTALDNSLVVYGYAGTQVEDVALANKVTFVDLTLSSGQIGSHKIIRKSDVLSISVDFVGYGVTVNANFSGGTVAPIVQGQNEFKKTATLNLSGLSEGTYTLSLSFVDVFGTTLTTNTMSLEVVADESETYVVNFEDGEFDVLVDGNIIENGTLLFKNHTYSFEFVPSNGYNLTSVSLGGTTYPTNIPVALKFNQDELSVVVQTEAQSILSIAFDTHDHGTIKVGGASVQEISPNRNSSVEFCVEADDGYYIIAVLLDGQTLNADSNGVYHINNITTNQNVEVVFEQAYWSITLSYVNASGACTVTPAGSGLQNIAHGESREFTILAKDGYVLDFVSVNGKKIEVHGNTFTISDIDEDKDVIISFKSASTIFDQENIVILYYFFVFLGLFVVFLLARLVLKFVKKNK